jgi:hypothetical protein
VSTDRAALRAAEVWRRHIPAGRDMSGRSFWTNLTFETWASMTGAVCLALQLAVEPALWWHWPPWEISRNLFGWIAFSFLLLSPVSGLLVERYLARRTPPGTTIPFHIRTVLFLIGCVPWLGLLLIPLWRRLMMRPPAWAVRSMPMRLDLDAPHTRLPRGSPLHRVYSSGAFGFWMITTGLCLPLSGGLWLAAGRDRGTILGTCIALHLAQAACMALHAESELRFTAQPRRSLRLIPWLCLLPQPISTLAMLLAAWPVLEGARGKTLTWSAYARRGGVKRLPRWLNMRLAFQQRRSSGSWIEKWTLPQDPVVPQREGQVETIRKTWMRTKAYLLLIEAPLAIGTVVWLAGGNAEPDRPWLLAVTALAALGLLHAAAGTLCRLLRLRLPAVLDPPAAGLYLFLTQAALAFALLAGPLAVHGRFRELALLTTVSAALAAMLSVLMRLLGHLIFQTPLTLATLTAWLAGFLILIAPPVAMALRPDLAPVGLGLAMLVPVVDVVIGAWSLPWLLYPFRRRDLFVSKLPGWTQTCLAFRMLVALLPLGGLALPAWLLLDALSPTSPPLSTGTQQ